MDKIEKIRQEIERRSHGEQGFNSEDAEYGYRSCARGLLSFLDTLSEEPDKSLEEAAEEYAKQYAQETKPKDADGEIWKVGDVMIENMMSFEDGFIAGAEWQASQMPMPEDTVLFNKGVQEGRRLEREDMMHDAVEGEIEEVSFNNGEEHNTIRFSFDEESLHVENRIWFPRSGKDGDKVRIVVLKEEEE